MTTESSSTTEFIMPTHVSGLISEQTRVQIGAREPLYGAERIQWTINRPSYVTDDGRCMVSVRPDGQGSYTVAVGRQGMCADIYPEAVVRNAAAVDVDATVLRVCTARSLGEVAA